MMFVHPNFDVCHYTGGTLNNQTRLKPKKYQSVSDSQYIPSFQQVRSLIEDMPGGRNVLLVLLSMMMASSVNFVVDVVWEDVSSLPIPVKLIVTTHYDPADY
jgi:hypothetical protein